MYITKLFIQSIIHQDLFPYVLDSILESKKQGEQTNGTKRNKKRIGN